MARAPDQWLRLIGDVYVFWMSVTPCLTRLDLHGQVDVQRCHRGASRFRFQRWSLDPLHDRPSAYSFSRLADSRRTAISTGRTSLTDRRSISLCSAWTDSWRHWSAHARVCAAASAHPSTIREQSCGGHSLGGAYGRPVRCQPSRRPSAASRDFGCLQCEPISPRPRVRRRAVIYRTLRRAGAQDRNASNRWRSASRIDLPSSTVARIHQTPISARYTGQPNDPPGDHSARVSSTAGAGGRCTAEFTPTPINQEDIATDRQTSEGDYSLD